MNDRYKAGGFFAIVGLLVLISNFRHGAPIFSFEMMPIDPYSKGGPVPYVVSWGFGVASVVYGALVLSKIVSMKSTLRPFLLGCVVWVFGVTLVVQTI